LQNNRSTHHLRVYHHLGECAKGIWPTRGSAASAPWDTDSDPPAGVPDAALGTGTQSGTEMAVEASPS
jgi:hypothetical protein